MKHILPLLFILTFFLSHISNAKKLPGQEEWNPGTLVLKNQEIIKGKIYYNVEYDLVQVLLDDKIKTYSAHNVHYFQFYDEGRGIKRLYAALDDYVQKNKKNSRITFYEVLLGGEMVLLRKEMIHYFKDIEILYNAIDLVPSIASKHYVLFNDELVPLSNFKKNILTLMGSHVDEVTRYIRKNNLETDDFVDQILIIDYFNYLKDPSYKMLENEMLVKE